MIYLPFVYAIFLLVYHSIGFLIPLKLTIISIIFVLLFSFTLFIRRLMGLIPFFFLFIYMLPFIHIPPYFFWNFDFEPKIFWGMASNPYMFDKEIINLTANIGLLGSLGILTSSLLYLNRHKIKLYNYLDFKENLNQNFSNSQSILVWCIWFFIGYFLIVISSSGSNIFEASYARAEIAYAFSKLNFDSSWMVGYGVIIFSFIDIYFTEQNQKKRIKSFFFLIFMIYYIVFLQLLRGDRESLTLIIAIIVFKYYYINTLGKKFDIPYLKFFFISISLLLINLIITYTRSEVSGQDFSYLISLFIEKIDSNTIYLSNLFYGTWSSVLLTPLSVAGDFKSGFLIFKFGEDYIDIIKSIPPGFIAELFDYQRPLTGSTGPAYEMRYGQGGTHASILPFRNFGYYGVFIISFITNIYFLKQEIKLYQNPNPKSYSFILFCLAFFPHWIWYGDKYLVNFFIIFFVLNNFYKLSKQNL